MKNSPTTNLHVYTRIIRYVKPYLKIAILCFICSILISLVHLLSLALLNPLGDILLAADGAQLISKKLQNLGEWGASVAHYLEQHVFHDKIYTLYIISALIAILTIMKGILRFTNDYFSGYIGHRVVLDISTEMHEKVIHQPLSFFHNKGVAKIVSRFTKDARGINGGVKIIFGKVIREPLKIISSLVICLWIHWPLTLIAFTAFPIAFFFIRNFGKKIKQHFENDLKKNANIYTVLQDSFQGIQTVKSYQMEQQRIDRYTQEHQRLIGFKMNLVKIMSLTNPFMEVFVTLAGLIMLVISAQMVIHGEISSGDFLAFYVAVGAMFDPLRKLADVNNRLNICVAAGERIFKFIDRDPEMQREKETTELIHFEDKIKFIDVGFHYQPDIPVLENISFEIKKGEVIAIVGRNGSGKSSLVSLLMRFYHPTTGKIKIDGHNIRHIKLPSLRRQFALVVQRPFLFNDTIKNNIVTSKVDISQQMMHKIAIDTHIEDFCQNLEQGYDTLYGAKGIQLSGGQEQRIALARAIARDANILILDEATANLDAESEHYINQALDHYIQNSTVIIVAHRFATIKRAHRILVLDQGQIEAFGTHEELYTKSPTYRLLYDRQFID